MILVLANMPRFGFGLWPHFCDDFPTWHMMTEPIYYKNNPCKIFWFSKRSSLQNNLLLEIVLGGTILKINKFRRDQKQQNKITGMKTKTNHICRDDYYILAKNKRSRIQMVSEVGFHCFDFKKNSHISRAIYV